MATRVSDALGATARVAGQHPGLSLLVLFGSRARGDAAAASDWDFGYLAEARLDGDALLVDLVTALGSERIDLVALEQAGGLVRYRAARDGIVVHESRPGIFGRFWLDAVTFWCDALPVLEAGYADLLAPAPVSVVDRDVLAERVVAVQRHLARVAERLPADPVDLQPSTDAADAAILHLWQAVQIVIDLGLAVCLHLKLGTPATYADALRRLAAAGRLDPELASRLSRAAGFRNVVAHAYERLDMTRVHRAARERPADLLRFLSIVRDLV